MRSWKVQTAPPKKHKHIPLQLFSNLTAFCLNPSTSIFLPRHWELVAIKMPTKPDKICLQPPSLVRVTICVFFSLHPTADLFSSTDHNCVAWACPCCCLTVILYAEFPPVGPCWMAQSDGLSSVLLLWHSRTNYFEKFTVCEVNGSSLYVSTSFISFWQYYSNEDLTTGISAIESRSQSLGGAQCRKSQAMFIDETT